MSLAQRCGHEFDTRAKSRGSSYFHSGHVRLSDVGADSASAQVVGSGGSSYQVDLDWSDAADGVISSRCSCPHFADGFLCKHLWATLLKLDAQGTGALVPGSQPLAVVDFDDEEWLDTWESNETDWDDGDAWGRGSNGNMPRHALGRHASGASGGWTTSSPGSSWQPSWRHVLGGAAETNFSGASARQLVQSALEQKDRLAWYVIHVAWSQQDQDLIIELAQQVRRKDGSYGQHKSMSLQEEWLPQFREETDRRFLTWVVENELDTPDYLGLDDYGGVRALRVVQIGPGQYSRWLPELCETGRLQWSLGGVDDMEAARSITWDGGGAWAFVPRVVVDSRSGGWRLEGTFARGDQRRGLSETVLVLESGLLLFEDCLGLWETGNHLPLLRRLHMSDQVSIPRADRDGFLEILYRLPYFDRIELPDELRLPEVSLPARPLLRVKAPERSSYRDAELYGEVLFGYGEQEVALSDPRRAIVEPEQHHMLTRDASAEEQRLTQLRGLPVHLPGKYDEGPGEVRFDRARLNEIVKNLIDLGWDVEAEGLLVRRPSDFNIQVTSNVDWFELSASVNYDGTVVQLPALLDAVRKGEKYVHLGDGSQGMLPDEWLARFQKLVDLGDEEADGIRFGRSQALLLDALLAEQKNVRTDLSFRKLRDRLRSFAGVRPGNPPRGFRGELRDYQKMGMGWFKFLQDLSFGGCLADDMGLGKTVQVLGLLQQRRTRTAGKGDSRKPSLCVVPKSLVFNWIDEAERFTPNLRVVNFTGLQRRQRQQELDEADLVVTTYGTLRRDIVELKDRRFDYVILDEAQAIKNHNSQAAKATRLLRSDHRLALTGTPIENHMGELWSLFEFLNPGMLGNNTAFAALCRGARNNGDGHALADLSKAIAPFVLRRTKEQVLKELPEKTEQTIHCELSKKERKSYDELREYYRARLTKQIKDVGLAKAKFHVLEALLRLRQAACHPGLIDKKQVNQPSAKLDALLEQISEVTSEGHKALVFSQFTSLLAIVRQRLDKDNIVYEYLDGRTRNRKEHVQRFQTDPKCPLFLISLKAGGHGLNLTAADYVFILDPWWNPAVEAQAIDRTHRIGQTRRVFAYRLIAKDTVEEKVVELQKQKRELAEAIVTANESLIRKLTAEDLQQILS